LEKLDLNSSLIKSLPRSIGKLKNLKVLDLVRTKYLSSLPEEIGELNSLEELNLRYSVIESLPPSISNLKNLKVLDLGGAKNMSEIILHPQLTRLTFLNIRVPQLTSLRILDISISSKAFLVNGSFFESLLTLLESSPLLHHLRADYRSLTREERLKIDLALACNKARYRTRLWKTGKGSTTKTGMPTKVWPRVLCRANHLFLQWTTGSRFDPVNIHDNKVLIDKPTAIYQILGICRESFVGILLDRRHHYELEKYHFASNGTTDIGME
jgi:hypothetical protein